MRAYFIANMYTAGIHAGIQSAHCLHEMYEKYRDYHNPKPGKVLQNWAENHKTIIVLNGGYSSRLRELFLTFRNHAPRLELPYANFHESMDALDGALTCVGIILPEAIYNFPKFQPTYEFKDSKEDPREAAGRAIYNAIENLDLAK